MKLDWMRGLKQEEKEKRIEMVQSARPTLELLKEILSSKLEGMQTEMLSQQNYESPSWGLKQADSVGAIRELNYVISLLTLDRETK